MSRRLCTARDRSFPSLVLFLALLVGVPIVFLYAAGRGLIWAGRDLLPPNGPPLLRGALSGNAPRISGDAAPEEPGLRPAPLPPATSRPPELAAFSGKFEGPGPVFVLVQHRLAGIYERLGNTGRSRYWYGRFLHDWRNADPGTPEVEEAKRRLAALGGPLPASGARVPAGVILPRAAGGAGRADRRVQRSRAEARR